MDTASLDPSRHARAEPSWDDLRIFLAVVAHGSMNGAGRALGQSQPTIARRVRALEECLGVDLFQRGPNSLVLTEAGRAVLEAASPMAEAARAVPKLAAAYRPDPAAPVRLTATMSVTMFLSHHAASLAQATAPAEIAYIPMRRKADLAAAEADIALRMRRMPEEEDLIVRRIGRIAFAIYARTPDVSAVIVPPEDPNLSRQAAFIVRYAAGRPIAARIGDVPIRYQAAKAGLGAAVLPCWLGDADPDLVRVADPTEEMVEDIFLVTHRRGRNRESVARVSAALVDLFRRERHALAGTRQDA
ncbi:LysR family transcriptional regulator [Microvirga thermotolerans]|uniref:LysR family transcriptional regulator n=1 Tax=Microvirga thermotolerans TaxID=2651334 RepID=A0A5P9JX75_9HYPH|nr:LysR family transcriptional regulator [Microvirga thermotolerans]QFU15825.1 LysR family transcriptional regulator [Microvirga thermotolerans]